MIASCMGALFKYCPKFICYSIVGVYRYRIYYLALFLLYGHLPIISSALLSVKRNWD